MARHPSPVPAASRFTRNGTVKHGLSEGNTVGTRVALPARHG
ncbi:hypothetical protein ACN28I_17030 [Archangium gephyra]